MTDSQSEPGGTRPRRRKTAILLWVVLALIGAGGGYYAVVSGLIPGPRSPDSTAVGNEPGGTQAVAGDTHGTRVPDDVVFVPIEPIMISLNGGGDREHLRFRAELEVAASEAEDVVHLMPRIVDLLNSYLRALEAADLQEPAALTRLRAQMLRRINIVTGPGRVRDLLIMEFVLN